MYILCYAPQDLVIEDSQEVVSFSSAHWLLYFGNIHLLVSGASLLNDHYRFFTVNILLLWMASISVIGVSCQLMLLKDKKVLYLKIHLVLFHLRISGSPYRPANGVFLVISPSPLMHFMFIEF
ncbi:hypothetical protein HID58_085257 [Brassica napus]|uniref:Uncharacterized protein n=1 Tax=Brassica napus TaxID=3708 RepID=A0ABQ7XM32_BRANA|nr:hypothetical protein HID58_085257 [Brassica napus]